MSGTTPPRDGVEIQVGYRALPGLGDHFEPRQVQPAEGDAPPWDARTAHTAVGSDHDRVDGLPKATGRAKYAYDINLPGMLHARILRAAVARGTLRALDLTAARSLPGVGAVVALKEVGHRVRFVGDALAAVAATTLDAARDALAAIVVECEAEPHNVDWLMAEDAPLRDQDGAIADDWEADEAIDAALAAAATTHSATYRTEVQTHSSLEPHGGVARWEGDDLEVWMSTQATFGVRNDLAQALTARGAKPASVTVHAEYVGGGFGSKFSAGIEGLAACLLAREAGAPVKLMLDRFEEHTTTGNRPAALMQVRAGLAADGTITAWDWRSFGGCGHSVVRGNGGGSVAAPDSYTHKAARRRRHRDLPTDLDPPRSMRAPGYPQGWFGAELFLDELAAKAGIDPLALRRHNDADAMRQDQWDHAARRFGWQEAKARTRDPGARRQRGVGMASARWGQLGGPGRGQPHGMLCRIHQDGTVEIRSGAQDIGTGLKTVMALLAAEELGIAPELVRATTGHTTDPSGPGSGGSTTTPSLAPAVRHAALLAKQQLIVLVALHLGVPTADVSCEPAGLGAGTARLAWRDACQLIGANPIEARGRRFPNYEARPFHAGVCGVQFAEAEVDTWTGQIRVTRMFALQDCGLVIAKKLAESQVLGAMIQAVSYALHEQRILDLRSGRMLNGDFLRYKIAGVRDLPELECELMSVANGHDNVGAAGLGEPPAVAGAAAIANAVFDALRVPVRHLPLTPDKVLRALARRS